MNYIYKLKYSNQDEFEAILSTLEGRNIETVVRIGTVVKAAVIDEEGNEVTPAQVLEGWHVDVLAHELIAELFPACIENVPTHPIHGYGFAEEDYIVVTQQWIALNS